MYVISQKQFGWVYDPAHDSWSVLPIVLDWMLSRPTYYTHKCLKIEMLFLYIQVYMITYELVAVIKIKEVISYCFIKKV